MKSIGICGAAFVVLGIAAGAASATPRQQTAVGDDLVTMVQRDCHSDVRRHYLPEYDRRVWHRHRQSNCRPVLVDPEYDEGRRDCHREVRRHYLPEYGRSLYHRHVGDRCRIRVYDEYEGRRPGGGQSCIQLGPITLCKQN